MPDTPLFWVNAAYDSEYASDGKSRYGAYVRDRLSGGSGFAATWDGTMERGQAEWFTRKAWLTACGPVMAPSYADWRYPVRGVDLDEDPDGEVGGLIATVELVTAWPEGVGKYGQIDGQRWQSWAWEHPLGGYDWCRAPYAGEVAKHGPYALGSLNLKFHIPPETLPPAPTGRPGVEEAARRAVAFLVAEFNRIVTPVARKVM